MASATETAPPPPSPPVGGNNPAARVLTERLGGRVLEVDDFRGDLAITVDRRVWVDAALLPARPSRPRLQALPRPVRRGLARPARGPLRGRAARCTRSRRSTTSA